MKLRRQRIARPAPDDWTISCGSLRCRHATGTIVFLAGCATAAEIAVRLAEAAATIARLTRGRRVR